MKKLLLIIVMMILSVVSVFAADFPCDVYAVQDYLYAKLEGKMSRAAISTDGIDAKMCMLQYRACKDNRAILRLLTRHIYVADQLMNSSINGDGQRGILIAYASLICANLYLKDKSLAAGIAVGIIQPNINFASDDFTSDQGKRYIANEILDAAKVIDNDEAIIKAFDLIINITQKYPNTVDAYHVKFAYYLNDHANYSEALAQLNAMSDPNMIAGVTLFKSNLETKLNKAVN